MIEDLSMVPEELRLCYKVLKNAGLLPPELELRKEIATLEALLTTVDTERDLESTISMLNEKILQLNILEKRSLPLEKKQYYVGALRKRLNIPPRAEKKRG